jgi:hypothetical protein
MAVLKPPWLVSGGAVNFHQNVLFIWEAKERSFASLASWQLQYTLPFSTVKEDSQNMDCPFFFICNIERDIVFNRDFADAHFGKRFILNNVVPQRHPLQCQNLLFDGYINPSGSHRLF